MDGASEEWEKAAKTNQRVQDACHCHLGIYYLVIPSLPKRCGVVDLFSGLNNAWQGKA